MLSKDPWPQMMNCTILRTLGTIKSAETDLQPARPSFPKELKGHAIVFSRERHTNLLPLAVFGLPLFV